MKHMRQRLSLLALGILAPVLAFGAIALSGAPSAAADGDYAANPYENPCNYSSVYCDPTASDPSTDPSYLQDAWEVDGDLYDSMWITIYDAWYGGCLVYLYCS